MAWLEQETSRHFHIAFRIGSKKFKRSLRTKDEREAEARRQRLEENCRLVESGRLEIPDNCDVAAFLLSDGKLNESPKPSRTISLGKLPEAYIESLPNNALEPNTVRIARLHMRHVTRILGARRTVCSVELEDLQRYVTKRSREPGKRGCVSAGTLKKELSTFSTMWTWSFDRGFVSAAFPKKGLKYPKREQSLPFQTWSQIDRQIKQGQLSREDQEPLWDCLYLSLVELSKLLADLKSAATADFLPPMCTMAAHTEARRSELCRSRVADFDFEEQTIRIRERKRSRGTRTTRTFPMTPHLAETMRAWFDEKSRSPFAFPEEHRGV